MGSGTRPVQTQLLKKNFFFRKFAEIFESEGAPPVPLVLLIAVANFATSTAGVVDSGGKFAAGVNGNNSRQLTS